MVREIGRDVHYTGKIMDGHFYDRYDKVYFQSNEILNGIFLNVDVCRKNVLTVLSSGDQTFHFLNDGARHVDIFDKNKLTFYYFYLRMWCIKYLDKFYLDYPIDKGEVGYILAEVIPQSEDEKCALIYWRKCFNYYNEKQFKSLFHSCITSDMNQIDDLSFIKKRIDDNHFNFFNIDLSKKVKIGKKYDAIFTSNITDYILDWQFKLYKDNLYNLLNDGGVIVSSANIVSDDVSKIERKVFKDQFKIHYLPKVKMYYKVMPGYVYKKKK